MHRALQALTGWLKQPLAGLWFRSDFDSVAWSRNRRQDVSKTNSFRLILVISNVTFFTSFA